MDYENFEEYSQSYEDTENLNVNISLLNIFIVTRYCFVFNV